MEVKDKGFILPREAIKQKNTGVSQSVEERGVKLYFDRYDMIMEKREEEKV